MSQDLFTNPFGIPPPSDDSYASLSRFIAEFSQAIPQDQFDSFRSKLTSLHEALTSKLRGETRPQDDMSEIRGMFQELREDMIQGQNSLREDMIQGQNSLREDMIQGQNSIAERLSRVEGRFDSFSISFHSLNGEQLSRIRNIETKTNETRTSAQRSENIINRKSYRDTKPIPFINGQEPPSDLPELKTISDVDNLNPSQLKAYLEGYGCKYVENEPQTSLKRKVSDVAGFIKCPHDNLYEFSTLQDIGNQSSTPNRILRSRHN
ncbi:hypothetical protein SPOG_03641 [Schizosaccharomyces cryophilus OY26]|uniref:Mug135-like C-terminal domain-containing protein n=1 Tax=Schizosaccharomyces cryophilus (strain OY26 / ATCC MYA-4695 / CBS 11777 / NBRC 106824 / NRRL Y48691) TaxID=653667 RepID=S9W3H7_SCHCR|nr:uncharacterized protein SPOG_03641 [Schizosaccharomyces cryophilus OY26]EPY53099.1 hypothetical protein SPOG_03641 [Schizosaccharomyces cryophilus OY26]